jgi:energy-coupling factor transport system substrate-specific component
MFQQPNLAQKKPKTVVMIGMGAILYGFLSYLTQFIMVDGGSLRPAIVVLTLWGALYGPLAGFFAGMLGALINDLLSMDVWLHWDIGNGIIGWFAGLAYHLKDFDLRKGRIRGVHYCWIAGYGLLGNYIGLTASALADVLLQTPGTDVIGWAIVPATVNAIWVCTLGLLVIAALAHRNASQSPMDLNQ